MYSHPSNGMEEKFSTNSSMQLLKKQEQQLVFDISNTFCRNLKPGFRFSKTRGTYNFTNAFFPSSLSKSKSVEMECKELSTKSLVYLIHDHKIIQVEIHWPSCGSMSHYIPTDGFNLRTSEHCWTIHLSNHLICDHDSNTKLRTKSFRQISLDK